MALCQILPRLFALHGAIESVLKGDTGEFTFDWLIGTSNGCIGLEVTRAEDTEQLNHIEEQLEQGLDEVTGTALTPWIAVGIAVDKKVKKSEKYREQLANAGCASAEMHLAIASLAQDIADPAVRGQVREYLAKGVGPFDRVWLVTHSEALEFDQL